MLENWSFEKQWTTDPLTGNQTPGDWLLTYRLPGAPMLSAGAFPGGSDVVIRTPECVHKLNWQLPPNEQLGGEDALILDGEAVYKVFGVGYSATLKQVISGFEMGSRLTFRVPVQVHAQGDDGQGAGVFRIGIQGQFTQWQTFGAGLEDREWSYITASVVVADATACAVRIDFEGRSSTSSVDFFIDALGLEIDAPEPEPPDCRGAPREQYERTYHVYYPSTTAEQRRALALHCADNQYTFGPSFDDAGLGDLDVRNAVLHYIPAERHQEFLGWFALWYPGVSVTFADTPDEPPADVIAYSQRDPEWSYLQLLPSTTTMGNNGCLVTDLAIYAALIDSEVTPGTLCLCLRENGGFNSSGGLIFAAVSGCLPYMDFRNYVLWEDMANMAVIAEALLRGPTILKVDWDVSDPDIDSHFVWAYDWTDETHTDISCIDPWIGEWTTILTAYPRGTIAQSIKGIVDFAIVDVDPPDPEPVAPIRPAGASDSTIGCHEMQTGPTGIQNFLQTTHPPAHLVAGNGCGPQLALAHAWFNDMLLFNRKVDDGLPLDNPGAAVGYVQGYIADLAPHFNLSDFSKPPIYILSINERGYECGNAAGIQQGVAWDIAFMDAVEATGLNLKAGVYKAAVGNPHVTSADLSLLLPMVARACAGKHLLCKHSYYASVPDQPDFFWDSGAWYQFRFAQDDAFFNAHGCFPYWAPAEAGACMATIYPTAFDALSAVAFASPPVRKWPNSVSRVKHDGDRIVDIVPVSLHEDIMRSALLQSDEYTVSLNPGAGWASCGSIQRYRDELLRCHAWYDNWNKTHGGRFVTVHLFTTGQWTWPQFDLQGANLDVVTAGLAGVL